MPHIGIEAVMGCAATTARVHFTDFKNRYIKLASRVRRCGIIGVNKAKGADPMKPTTLAVAIISAACAFDAVAAYESQLDKLGFMLMVW